MKGGSISDLKKSKQTSPFHYGLLSVLDSAISIIVVSPCVVGYWRGVWELISMYIYPEEPFFSGIISIVIGFSGHFLAAFFKDDIKSYLDPHKRRLTYLVLSRLYTIFLGFTCVNTMRGIWLLMDEYTDDDELLIVPLTLGCAGVLLWMRCFRNCLSAPVAVNNDIVEEYFDVPTMFKTPVSYKSYLIKHNLLHFFRFVFVFCKF